MQIPILSILTWLPICSAGVIMLIPDYKKKLYKPILLLTIFLQSICFIYIIHQIYLVQTLGPINHNLTSLYFVERLNWMRLPLGNFGSLSVDYFLGVDGLNITLLGLAIVVLYIGAFASWSIKKYVKGYVVLYLLLNTLIIGSLVALDFLLFYIFLELTLLPLYFLIGMWGDKKAPYAATKFFLYTLLGTIFMLVVVIGLGLSTYDPITTGIQAKVLQKPIYHNSSLEDLALIQEMVHNNQIPSRDIVHTFNLLLMSNPKNFVPYTSFSPMANKMLGSYSIRLLGFIFLVIGFFIKLAIVPLHSWLPDAHVQAPTSVSIILAGISLKLGGYGLLRTAYSIFPEGAIHYGFWIGIIGIISGIYAALNALAMQDLKKMIAYSSIAHMGFFLVGIGSLTHEGMQGALYQLVSHGLIASALFLVVEVLYRRTQDRTIENYSGLASHMPYYTTISLIIFAAALGIPGFSTFIGELLILLGAFRSSIYSKILGITVGILGGVSIFLNTTYYVWTIQRMFGGKFSLRFPAWETTLKEITTKEGLLLILIIVTVLLLGICPNLLLNLTNNATNQLIDFIYKIGKENLQLLGIE